MIPFIPAGLMNGHYTRTETYTTFLILGGLIVGFLIVPTINFIYNIFLTLRKGKL